MPGTPRADGVVEGEEGEGVAGVVLSACRRRLGDLMDSFASEAFLVGAIVVYGIVMLVEIMRGGVRHGDSADKALIIVAFALLCVFVVEIVLKTAAFGARFLLVTLNALDVAAVLASLVLAALSMHSTDSSGGGGDFRASQLALRVVLISLRLYRVHRLWREVHGQVRVRAGIETPVEKVIAILHDVRRRYALDEEGDQELGWVLHTVATGGLYVPILRDPGHELLANGKDGDAVDRETENWIMSNFTPTHAEAAAEKESGGDSSGGGGGGGGGEGGAGASGLGGGNVGGSGGGPRKSVVGPAGARNRRHTMLRSQSPPAGHGHGAGHNDPRRSTLASLFAPHVGGHGGGRAHHSSGSGGSRGHGQGASPTAPKRRISLSVRQLQFALPDCAELLSDQELLRLNEKIDDFDYDVFRLDELSHGRSLFIATVTLFRKYDLCPARCSLALVLSRADLCFSHLSFKVRAVRALQAAGRSTLPLLPCDQRWLPTYERVPQPDPRRGRASKYQCLLAGGRAL